METFKFKNLRNIWMIMSKEKIELHYWTNIYGKWQPQSNFLETGLKITDAYRMDYEIDFLGTHLNWWSPEDPKARKYIASAIERIHFKKRTEKELDEIVENHTKTGVLETNIQKKLREDKKIPSNKDRDVEAKKRAGSILSYEDWLTFIEEFPWQNPLFTYS